MKMKQRNLKMAKQETKEDEQDQPVDSELANIVEAALYASKEPLGIRKIMALFPEDAQPSKVDIQNVILTLEEQCEFRGVELRRIGKGWRYQSKEKYSPWLRKLSGNKPPRYSRALLETLSIIAYRQPVTRGDIEEIRGVGVSSDTIRVLEERDWVVQIGHRDVPGRPALFGTSQGFLEYFNMTGLRELPELMDKRDLGEIAKDMNLTLPMDGVQGEEDAAEHQAGKQSDSEKAEVIELHPEGADGSEKLADPSNDSQADESASDGVEDRADDNLGDELHTPASELQKSRPESIEPEEQKPNDE